jgi:acetylornithine aminotransferase
MFFSTYRRIPVDLDRGEGAYLFARDGTRYLDMFAGIAVNALGHCHAAVVEAAERQLRRYIHASNYFLQDPQVELARSLLQHTGYSRVFFTNSGTEATEAAIKIARRYGLSSGKTQIFGLSSGFHGRTMGALSLMDRATHREGFGPFLDRCSVLPFNDSDALRRSVGPDTLALFVEFVQGEAGVYPIREDVVEIIEDLRRKHGFLLVADEVQTGLGRTGKMFAFEHYGARPDMVLVAKSLGGGFPLGAVLGSEVVAGTLQPGSHGSTFGGNPVACAAGVAVLRALTDGGVIASALSVGDALLTQLQNLRGRFPDIVTDVRGRGLMIGVEFNCSIAEIAEAMLREKVLVNTTGGNTLRIVPCLTITERETEEFVRALERVIRRRKEMTDGRQAGVQD